ncbi:MAG: FAD-dependent oxidoreductase [Gammaproteobacteria bacterium]
MTDIAASAQAILVVGAGISGVTAALRVVEAGRSAILVERKPWTGGHLSALNPSATGGEGAGRFRPDLASTLHQAALDSAIARGQLRLMTQTDLLDLQAQSGLLTARFRSQPRYVNARCTACGACAEAVESEFEDEFNGGFMGARRKGAYLPHPMAYPRRYVIDPRIVGSEDARRAATACRYNAIDLDEQASEFELRVGAVIWATGWRPYDPKHLQTYNHGAHGDVISALEFERMAAPTGPTSGRLLRPSDGKPARNVAFVQCAGSRDLNHLRHCSGVCCMGSLRQAEQVKQSWATTPATPPGSVTIYHTDLRVSAEDEAFLARLRATAGIRFVRSKVARIARNSGGGAVCHGVDTEGGAPYANPHDLVVLALGMQPEPGLIPPGVRVNADGFLSVDETVQGVFPAGAAHEAMDADQCARHATAAAMRAIHWLEQTRAAH